MRKYPWVFSALIIAALAAACSSTPPDLSRLPRELLVLPRATALKTSTARDGASELFYVVNDTEFPAVGSIATIRSHVESLGWRPLTRYWLDPSMTLDWTFATFSDGRRTPNERVHQWDGEWTDGNGSVVLYVLRYRSKATEDPFGVPDNRQIQVTALYVPAEAVRVMRQGITAPLQ